MARSFSVPLAGILLIVSSVTVAAQVPQPFQSFFDNLANPWSILQPPGQRSRPRARRPSEPLPEEVPMPLPSPRAGAAKEPAPAPPVNTAAVKEPAPRVEAPPKSETRQLEVPVPAARPKSPPPPPRELAARSPTPPPAPTPPQEPRSMDETREADDAHCTNLLAAGYVTFESTASLSGVSGGEFCGDVAPVRMSAVRLRNGRTVEFRPAVTARCETAHVFADWVREDIAPAAEKSELDLERVDIAASYHCRPRNNILGAKLSEHGLANAVDVYALRFAGNRVHAVENSTAPPALLAEMRRSACERFTTVLGPGADAAHANHIHVDLARRRGGYRLCQWNMPDWPEP